MEGKHRSHDAVEGIDVSTTVRSRMHGHMHTQNGWYFALSAQQCFIKCTKWPLLGTPTEGDL